MVPETNLPGISTGKRCKDSRLSEEFVVLGFTSKNKEKMSKLSMVAIRDSFVRGLVIRNGNVVQKDYELRDLSAVSDIGSESLKKKERVSLQAKFF